MDISINIELKAETLEDRIRIFNRLIKDLQAEIEAGKVYTFGLETSSRASYVYTTSDLKDSKSFLEIEKL